VLRWSEHRLLCNKFQSDVVRLRRTRQILAACIVSTCWAKYNIITKTENNITATSSVMAHFVPWLYEASWPLCLGTDRQTDIRVECYANCGLLEWRDGRIITQTTGQFSHKLQFPLKILLVHLELLLQIDACYKHSYIICWPSDLDWPFNLPGRHVVERDSQK